MNVWPETYSIDWETALSIQSVSQVVDGKWQIANGEVHTVEVGYDRIIAIGDRTWQDYEATVPITFHSIAQTNHQPGVGILLRWQGHTTDGDQPSTQWWPLGALMWYRWYDTFERFEMIGDTVGRIADLRASLAFGTQYIFKARVETIPEGSRYSLKVWDASEQEPDDWTLVGTKDQTDLQSGSFLLISHYVDASFGNVSVVPLD
jgi:hypothetical protein